MNDVDDIRRAIDDDIYAHGRALEPTDSVRRAIRGRRAFNRFAVAGTSALVAASAVVAVTLIRPSGNEASIGAPTTTPTGSTSEPTPTSLTPTPPPISSAPTDGASPSGLESPSPAISTGAALPEGGVSGLLAAVQWRRTYGALVVVDPATGAVVHTYTTGITNPASDVLRFGNEAYFAAKRDAKGCAAAWTGVDLVTGNPTAVPSPLTDHPVQSAAMTANGDIYTSDVGCTTAPALDGYGRTVAADGTTTYQQTTHVAPRPFVAFFGVGQQRQMAALEDSTTGGAVAPTLLVYRTASGLGDSAPRAQTIKLPEGCTPTAGAFLGQEFVAGVSCQINGALVLTVLRWDASGALIMRKDLTTKFKEASISDVAVVGKDVYYVVNAEGTNADLFRLTEGKDVSVATDLFHIAAQP